MIYSTLVAPSEKPPRLTDIKRALLTFDKVFVPEPQDRDLIPPQSFMAALGFPFLGFNHGPVRPIGKIPDYDRSFDKLMNLCEPARQQGHLQVISSYEHFKGISIGAVPIGDYPLNPRAMLLLFRSLASNNDFLFRAVMNDPSIMNASDDYLYQIAVSGCNADGGINDNPPMPLIEGEMTRPHLREPITLIARGRVATTLKTIGFCAAKNMVPFFTHDFYNQVARQIVFNATRFIDQVAVHDPFWANRSLALRVAHEEYVDEDVLENMTVEEVVKLRTRLWGRKSENRDVMLKSIAAMSKEAKDAKDFETKCRELISSYKKDARKLEDEWANLKFKVKCDLGKAMAAVGATVGAGELLQVQSAIGIATALLAGCVYAIERVSDYGPITRQLRASEEEFQESAGFGLHQFYKEMNNTTNS